MEISMNKYIALTLLTLALGFITTSSYAQTTGSAFNYQGELLDNGSPANGDYNFVVKLFSTETGGSAVIDEAYNDVSVENGLFNLEIDFGDMVYEDSEQYYLEFDVTPSAGGSSAVLAPRTKLLSVPYATQALFGTSSWDVDGTTLYTLGKVGIGVNNPSDRLHIRAIAADEGALRVQIDNNTKLRVQANGGTSLGINSPPSTPENGLYVSGDVKQRETSSGMLKYMLVAQCDSFPTIEREYNGTNIDGSASIVNSGTGRCDIDLPFDTSQSFVVVSALNPINLVNRSSNCVAASTSILCKFEDSSTGVTVNDAYFTLLVY